RPAARAGHVHARRRNYRPPGARRPARRAGTRRRGGGSRAAGSQAVSTPAALARIEELIDAAGIAPRIEAMLPIGVRHRQLRVRTLLGRMLVVLADQRPAHLTRIRDALIALPGPVQVRLVVTDIVMTGS